MNSDKEIRVDIRGSVTENKMHTLFIVEAVSTHDNGFINL